MLPGCCPLECPSRGSLHSEPPQVQTQISPGMVTWSDTRYYCDTVSVPLTFTTRTDALRSSWTQAWMAALVLHTIFFPPDTRLNLFLQSGVRHDPGLILVRPEFMLGLRGMPLLKLEGSFRTLKSLLPPSGSLVSRVCQSLVPGTYLE